VGRNEKEEPVHSCAGFFAVCASGQYSHRAAFGWQKIFFANGSYTAGKME